VVCPINVDELQYPRLLPEAWDLTTTNDSELMSWTTS